MKWRVEKTGLPARLMHRERARQMAWKSCPLTVRCRPVDLESVLQSTMDWTGFLRAVASVLKAPGQLRWFPAHRSPRSRRSGWRADASARAARCPSPRAAGPNGSGADSGGRRRWAGDRSQASLPAPCGISSPHSCTPATASACVDTRFRDKSCRARWCRGAARASRAGMPRGDRRGTAGSIRFATDPGRIPGFDVAPVRPTRRWRRFARRALPVRPGVARTPRWKKQAGQAKWRKPSRYHR